MGALDDPEGTPCRPAGPASPRSVSPPRGRRISGYLDPPDTLAPPFRAAHEARAAWTAANGEPLLSHFAAEDLAARLRDLGLRDIENLDYHELCTRYESGMAVPPPGAGGHIIAATV
jgi:hypothetical protein